MSIAKARIYRHFVYHCSRKEEFVLGEEPEIFECNIQNPSILLLSNGLFAFTQDERTIMVFDINEEPKLQKITCEGNNFHPQGSQRFFQFKDKFIVVLENRVQIWSILKSKKLELLHTSPTIQSVIWSATIAGDETKLVLGTQNGLIYFDLLNIDLTVP